MRNRLVLCIRFHGQKCFSTHLYPKIWVRCWWNGRHIFPAGQKKIRHRLAGEFCFRVFFLQPLFFPHRYYNGVFKQLSILIFCFMLMEFTLHWYLRFTACLFCDESSLRNRTEIQEQVALTRPNFFLVGDFATFAPYWTWIETKCCHITHFDCLF